MSFACKMIITQEKEMKEKAIMKKIVNHIQYFCFWSRFQELCINNDKNYKRKYLISKMD